MAQEIFDNPELKDVFDDLISQDKFDILSCNENYSPPILSFKEICTYTFLGKTIAKIDSEGFIPKNDYY